MLLAVLKRHVELDGTAPQGATVVVGAPARQ